MKIHTILVLLLALFVNLASPLSNKRNVLVMVADDEGIESPLYGNPSCKTPNLQELASRGVLFKNAYTAVSSCSPSRSAIMTGLPSHQNGMYGLEHAEHHFRSFDNVMSLPRILNATNRYWTGIIGKKHVAPEPVYPFSFSRTEQDGYSTLQVGRNITLMKEYAREFLSLAREKDQPFFLYIGFHDCHRAGGSAGEFAEKFGDGKSGHGLIPDWKPVTYDINDVHVPYFIPDTPTARQDIANQYKSISRLDQGVGLMLKALKDYKFDDSTLIIYTSDNGSPFPNAKTNLYESGMQEPMLVSNPLARQRWGKESTTLVSTTSIVPTILEWLNESYPGYNLFGPNPTKLQSPSLLPVTVEEPQDGYDTVFASHNSHEIIDYYPMRVVRTKQYRLIHNLNYGMPFPIATDLFSAPTYQEMLKKAKSNESMGWFKTLPEYYHRNQWELFDVVSDPKELTNLADDPKHSEVFASLKETALQLAGGY